jgi:cytochrome oxidase Cu insertion factor (SCO1/SenC/PrrC family)
MQDRLHMIFITVDPERDTVDMLKNYVPLFDPKLVGLTGSVDRIEDVKAKYKVYAAKVPEGDSYTMDHSSFIYFMAPGDKLLALFKPEQTAADMDRIIRGQMDGAATR